MQKTSLLGNSLIWFGAAVSVAEILTGTLLAPLGFWKAAAAIFIGHLIGCLLLYFAGLIGAKYSVTSMEGAKISFGSKGGGLFAVLNLIQLVGWTAVMISAGAQSAHSLFPMPVWGWVCIIGALIVVWTILKTSELKILNSIAVILLFTLSVVLSTVVFKGRTEFVKPAESVLHFGEAVELSIAMPLSWLPLIADYTCNSSKPKTISLLSASVYFIISCWMYMIGLGAALYAGENDISAILSKAGLGSAALLIVIFSTVTTTYLDIYSSEMSCQSITKKIPALYVGIGVCCIGVLMAIFCTVNSFELFLYWIGSVFAPMISIQISDFFICGKKPSNDRAFDVSNLVIWAVGFILYRILLAMNPVCGSTIPVIIVTMLICLVYNRMARKKA